MAASVKRNFFYQMIFQVVKILIPFITVPIISKALGAEGIGVYSFTSSIAQYFILLSEVGILLYGNREIAMARDDPEKTSQLFSELVALKGLMTFLSLIIYWIVVQTFFKADVLFYLIQLINIVSVFFDITWFFMGLEDFKTVSLINTVIQIGVFFLLIWKIKKPSDLIFYMLIKATGEFLGFSLIWLLAMKKIRFKKVQFKTLIEHLKKTLFYFIPQVGVILYTTLTTTLLGFLKTSQDVGVYTNALHLIVTITTLLTTIDFVLLPRISHLFANKQMSQIMTILNQSIHVQLFLSIPAAFGIAGIAKTVVPWFFGETFLAMTGILPLLSLAVIMMPFGMVLSRQYLLPLGKTKEYTLSVLGGAGVSVLLNIFLIPRYGLMGAVISTIAVESVIAWYRVMILLKQTDFVFEKKRIAAFVGAGLGMYLVIVLYGRQAPSTFKTTMIQVGLGLLTYGILSFVLKVPYFTYVYESITERIGGKKEKKKKSLLPDISKERR